MKLLAGLLLLSAFAARAEDGGRHITFKGAFSTERLEVPAGAVAGDPLWESGPSDPVKEDFTAVIFHGRSSDAGIAIEGSKKEGADWGPWKDARIERFPNGRFWGTAPLNGRAGDSVRLRIVNRGMPAAGSIQIYEIEAVSPDRETVHSRSETPALPTAPPANAPKPRVHPRGEWHAAAPKSPYEPMIPVRITVHHTEGPRPMTLEDAIQEMQVIQKFHQNGRGWNDIGYHFLIDGSGRVFQGRPETVIGAHVRNKNEGNVGVSIMGSFQKPQDQQPNKAQIKSLIAVARWLAAAYSIDPETIKGHRDQMDTSCPGDNLYALLPKIRKAVAEPAAPPPLTAKPAVRLPAVTQGGLMFDTHARPR